MNEKWGLYPTSSTNGDSGILKKITKPEPDNNLLVFGYSCKIFRDDAKAQFIDQGKHLIKHPLCPGEDIKIDRYDARGALNDLAQYEAPPGGYNNRLDYLSPSEQRAELLCEEERYFSLFNNEVEEELYFEESLKRQTAGHGQIAFNYDSVDTAATTVKNEDSNDAENEEDLEPFVPPHNFDIPIDIEQPDSMKLHAIIEKTARFISGQGAQMEILLKAKQANNRQFDFLNQDCKYFNYYRHVLSAMKNNCYPVLEETNEVESQDVSVETELQDDNVPQYTVPVVKPTIVVPQIRYKPSKDCSYTQLISKITGAPIPVQQPLPLAPPLPPATSFYDFNSIAQPELPTQTSTAGDQIEVKKPSNGLLGLIQNYNSGSESENEDDDNDTSNRNNKLQELQFDGVHPPDYLKNVIDKTASYVAKNGKDFEEILRTKQDPRFEFLNVTGEFYPYYAYKVQYAINPYEPVPVVPLAPPQAPPAPIISGKSLHLSSTGARKKIPPPILLNPKLMVPVSFSIKPKDESNVPASTASKPTSLPLSVSDEDNKKESSTSQTNGSASENGHSSRQMPVAPPPPSISNDFDDAEEDDSDSNLDKYNLDLDLMIDINDDLLERKVQAKRAEEKLRDKIASAAREKLGLISKEKQLQMERRKKAMAFLNNIKVADVPATPSKPVDDDKSNDSDIGSIHSIPSSIDDVEEVIIERVTTKRKLSPPRSRSRSRSTATTSSRHKHKKSKSSHSKKKSKRKERRSQSRSPHSRSHSKHRISKSSSSSSKKKKKYRD